jgi:hypothetical protein
VKETCVKEEEGDGGRGNKRDGEMGGRGTEEGGRRDGRKEMEGWEEGDGRKDSGSG